jgi:hypothetical protein
MLISSKWSPGTESIVRIFIPQVNHRFLRVSRHDRKALTLLEDESQQRPNPCCLRKVAACKRLRMAGRPREVFVAKVKVIEKAAISPLPNASKLPQGQYASSTTCQFAWAAPAGA